MGKAFSSRGQTPCLKPVHSKEREVPVDITCYLDESGTDNDSCVAVVGGLLLDCSGFSWLDADWKKALLRHRITPPIHMREFTPRGRFASVNACRRHALFSELVGPVNDHKTGSIGAILTAEKYRSIFAGISSLSMYAACFAQVVMTSDVITPRSGYDSGVHYVLDSGNPHRNEIRVAHSVLRTNGSRIGTLEFGSDNSNCALQAADMISWAMRRSLDGGLSNGFEPLANLFDEHHNAFHYEEEWMRGVADKLRSSALVGRVL